MNRRHFLGNALAALAGPRLLAQAPQWGGPVLDIHLHLRSSVDSNVDHIEGCGVTRAVLLTRVQDAERAKAAVAEHNGRFVFFTSVNVTQPDALTSLRKTAAAGSLGFGELKTACSGLSSVTGANSSVTRLLLTFAG